MALRAGWAQVAMEVDSALVEGLMVRDEWAQDKVETESVALEAD